jgi:N-acyl amino acid synthase of PEP-CTERM/exosortase system
MNSQTALSRLALPLSPVNDPPRRMLDRYFEYARVDGTPDLDETYRIRFQVYCLERGLLPPEIYPDGIESDLYDRNALHFLASHVSGRAAGTARLALNGPLGLPMAAHCRLDPDYAFLADPDHPDLKHYAEISRLAVSKAFRRRQGDSFFGGPPRTDRAESDEIVAFYPRNDAPEIVSGIFRMFYHESKRLGITHWVVAMERGLNLMLKRMAFVFAPIGPESDYYGPVRPYMAEIAAIERHLARTRPETLRYMTFGLEPELLPDALDSHQKGHLANSA